MKRAVNRPQLDPEKPDERAKTEDNQIDQALADSFPASDAPPWTLGVKTATKSPKQAGHD